MNTLNHTILSCDIKGSSQLFVHSLLCTMNIVQCLLYSEFSSLWEILKL